MNIAKAIRSTLSGCAVRLVCLLPEGSNVRAKTEFAYHWLCFVYRHHRLPGRRDSGFNAFLFSIKTDGTLANPLRRRITDKEFGKQYVDATVGGGWTVDTLAVLKTPDEVSDFSAVAFPLVVKPTHSSGRVLVVHSEHEYRLMTARLHRWLTHDYFLQTMEHNYVGLEKKIIVEPYLNASLSLEGSIHCRAGRVKIISMIDRFDTTKRRTSLNRQWQPLHVALGQPYSQLEIERPVFLDALIEKTEAISSAFSYLRVDFYASADRFVFGELTNLPGGGLARFSSKDGERRFSHTFFG